MNNKQELNDEQLSNVAGGSPEWYRIALNDIGTIFGDAFVNNDGIMTPQLANNTKYQAQGMIMAYKKLGYLDDQEYRELIDLLEQDYELWLQRCN